MLSLLLVTVLGAPEVVLQTGHAHAVTAVAGSSRAALLATGEYYHRSIKLWDLRTDKELLTIEPTGDVSSLAFDLDGTRLYSASCESVVEAWDTATGRRLDTLQNTVTDKLSIVNLHNALAVSSKGVVAGYSPAIPEDHQDMFTDLIGLWDAKHQPLGKLSGHKREVTALAFSPDGRFLASGDQDGVIFLWDVAQRRQLRKVTLHVGEISRTVLAIAWSSDGKRLLSADEHGAVKLWRFADARELHGAALHDNGARCLRFADGDRRMVLGQDDTLAVWNLARWQAEKPVGLGVPVQACAAGDRDTLVWVAAGRRSLLVDLQRGAVADTLEGRVDEIFAGAPSPGGEVVLAVTAGGAAAWDARSGERLATLSTGRGDAGVAFGGNGKSFVLAGRDGIIEARDWPSRAHRWTARAFANGLERMALSSDGRFLAAAGSELGSKERIRLFDLASGRRVGDAVTDSARIWSVGFAFGGSAVTMALFDRLELRRVPDLEPLSVLDYKMDPGVAHAASGDLVAFAAPEGWGHTYVWDLKAGKLKLTLDGNAGTMAFSADGKRLAIGGWLGGVAVYDMKDGRALSRWTPGLTRIMDVAFLDGGATLMVTTLGDGIVTYTVGKPQPRSRLLLHGHGALLITEDGYYSGTQEALPAVAFRVRGRSYPLEQFDARFNRPDRVLESMGVRDSTTLDRYREAYLARLEKLGLAEKADDGPLPELTVKGTFEKETTRGEHELTFQAADGSGLGTLEVIVNEVPAVFRLDGQTVTSPCRLQGRKKIEGRISVDLSYGRNKLQIWVRNAAGVRSLAQTREIWYALKSSPRPEIYVAAVGVAHYGGAADDLPQAAVDARSVVDAFMRQFAAVHPKILPDAEINKEGLRRLKGFFAQAGVNDRVVLFLSGHAGIDASGGYQLALPRGPDGSAPRLKYAEIEALLDGIRSRQKLLLLDTCFSGEIDRVSPAVVALLKQRFLDLRQTSGTVVIAAARGTGFAKEGKFAPVVVEGIDGAADGALDGSRDGRVTVGELSSYLQDEVERRTQGRQTPTVRYERREFDFAFR